MEQEQNTNPEVKKLNISTPAAIITAGVLIAVALIFSGKGNDIIKKPSTNENVTETKPVETVSLRQDDHVFGDLNKAEVVIVEYSDSDCPFCQRFHQSMKDVIKDYGTKVAWVYRYFPLSIHANAGNEAIALECSAELGGNDVFWKYLDEVIEITVSPEKSANILTSTAVRLGLDEKLFSKCLTSQSVAKKIADQSAEAQALGARGTPYSIVINKKNEQVAIPGAYPIEEIKKIIDGLMK